MNEKKFLRFIENTVNCIVLQPSDVSTTMEGFFVKCPRQQLREGTLKVFKSCYKKLKANSSNTLQKIMLCFQAFLKGKAEREEVQNQQVSDSSWRSSMKICAFLDPTQILLAIDILFHISNPESLQREESIRMYIKKSLEDENTSYIGLAWQNICSDLKKLKLENEIYLNVNDEPCKSAESDTEVDENSDDETYVIRDSEVGRIIAGNTRFPVLCYSRVILKQDPNANCFNSHWTVDNEDDNEFISKCEKNHEIGYINYFEGKKSLCSCRFPNLCRSRTLIDPDEDQNIISNNNHPERDENIVKFEKLFMLAMGSHKRLTSSCTVFLNNIFHINKPKTEKHQTIIYEYVRKLIRNKQTFGKGIDMIHYFELYQLRDELNEEIIYNSYFFKKRDLVINLFTFHPHKQRRIEILDNLLTRALLNKLETEIEKRIVKLVGIKTLPRLIWNLSQDDEIEPICIQRACRAIFMEKIKNKYHSMAIIDPSEFELYVVETLKTIRHIKFDCKLDFLEDMVSENAEYAYCWAKYFKTLDYHLPPSLRNCEHFDTKAEEFVKALDDRLKTPFGAGGICNFFGKEYKFIYCNTRETFKNFQNEYLLTSESLIIGIDIESGKHDEAVLLQLSTKTWICLMDILLLYPLISKEEWMIFF